MVDDSKSGVASSKTIFRKETASEVDSVFERREKESFERVEAALFIAGRFLSTQELIVLTDVNPVMLKDILHRLLRKYEGGVLRLVRRGESWKMDVEEKYHYLINKLATGTAEFTKAEQETLAIIAFKQPVKQSVVIKIRGNKSYDHIRKFRDLGLVRAVKVGHTFDLSLSEEFYEYFNVYEKDPLKEKEKEKERGSEGE